MLALREQLPRRRVVAIANRRIPSYERLAFEMRDRG
jgi:hypothetical protein